MAQVFDGIIVLDFTLGMPGSVSTMVMSDFGAEIIKVEPPGGDPFRDWPGAIQWNRGKKSVILDLKTPGGQEKAQQLAQQADVVIENFRPGVTKRLGIDYESLSAVRPDLVYCSLTGFGPEGPYANYKGYEGVVAAKSGRMQAFAGQNGRDGPNYAAVRVAGHSSAMAIIRGVIAGLYVRDKTRQGQKVETSLLQAITPYDVRDWIHQQMMKKDPETYPADEWVGRGRPRPMGYLAACTKDGQWIQLANIVQRLFRSMIHSLDMSFIFEDPRFNTAPVLTDEDRAVLEEMILKRVHEKTLEEWMDIFHNQTSEVAVEPFMTAQEGMNHPQVVHNGHVLDVKDPRIGKMRQLGPLLSMRETPGSPKAPSPSPGQHTEEVLSRINGMMRRAPTYSSLPLPTYPLEGVIVLDLGTVIAGPLGCSLLAELGARVIHIESPEGDYHRHVMQGLVVHRTLAGAEGFCLNLKTSEGQEIMHKLVAKADILLHNMRPGAPERLGVGYEQLSEINPRLVYLYAAGYGSTGPRSQHPSMAPIPGAVCGGAMAQMGRDSLLSSGLDLTMEQITEISRRLGQANDGSTDHNSSMVNSVAMLLGLHARERTGRGQYVETSMLGSNAYANVEDFFWHEGKPPRLIPDSDGYGLNALYRLYPAKEGWVFLACPFDKEWRVLCKTIGRVDLLEDPRFVTREVRQKHDLPLADELRRIFVAKEPLEWEQLLTAADVACVKVEERGPYQFFDEDTHVRENCFLTEVEAPRLGKFWRYSPLINFSHTRGKVGPGPLKGQHTQAIVRELGYGDAEICDLKERGVVDWENP